MAGQRLADRMELVRMLVRDQAATAAALGHAVIFDQATGPALEDIRLKRRAEGGAGAELHLEAGQVIVAKGRLFEDAAILHRHQHGVGHAVLVRQLEEAEGVELIHQDRRAAHAHGGEEADQGRVGIERCRQKGHRTGAIAQSAAPARVGPPHLVRLNNALGRARGA